MKRSDLGSTACRAGSILVFLALVVALVVPGCSQDELFGPGGGVSASVVTPTGQQSGVVRIDFTLTDDEETSADIAVRYSKNGGSSYVPASAAAGSVGTRSLAVSVAGASHAFLWDSGADLGAVREEDLRIRISVRGGTRDTTAAFSVRNLRHLLVTHDEDTASVTLHRLDVVAGAITSVQTLAPGGRRPWDVVFHEGRFFVANRGSNDVTVLDLDVSAGTVRAVAGSPFASDGTSPKYLATDGRRLFVSNITSGTISVHDIDASTGRLSLTATSGVAAASCRSLVVSAGRLYVADEAGGRILIFDIGSGGELIAHPASPFLAAGGGSPVGLVVANSWLYAGNYAVSTLAALRLEADGSLVEVAGSPFTFGGLQALQLAHGQRSNRIFVATEGSSSFATLALDALGIATQDVGSPRATSGPPRSVVTAGDVVVVGTGSSRGLESFAVDRATGALTAHANSPYAFAAAVGRMAVSD